jgi:serine/threonine protein kinase
MKIKLIYHLDIKPENILLNNYNEMKFTDFGTAR